MAKASDVRATPVDVVLAIERMLGYRFDLDAAAMKSNAVCGAYLGPDHENWRRRDALAVWWFLPGSRVWLNCPYSEIPIWLRHVKANVKSAPVDFRIVCLLPSSTSSEWWQTYVWNVRKRQWRPLVRSVQFWPKRINFAPHFTGAKWPSVVVEFGKP